MVEGEVVRGREWVIYPERARQVSRKMDHDNLPARDENILADIEEPTSQMYAVPVFILRRSVKRTAA